MSDDDLMTSAETAELLRCTENALAQARYERRDTPPFVRIGRRVLYRRSAVLAWLDSRTVDPSKVA